MDLRRLQRVLQPNVVALFIDQDLTPQELGAAVPRLLKHQVAEALSKKGDYYRLSFRTPKGARNFYNSIYGDSYPMKAPPGATKTVYASLTIRGQIETENS